MLLSIYDDLLTNRKSLQYTDYVRSNLPHKCLGNTVVAVVGLSVTSHRQVRF